MIFGFNDNMLDGSKAEKIALTSEMGANAIEFGFHIAEEFETVKALIESTDLEAFDRTSIHAPGSIRYDRNEATERVLQQLEELVQLSGAVCVVIHPDLVDDWDILIESGIPFAVENMDHNKEFGKTVDDIVWVNERTEFPVVIDLNHCYTNDPTMKLAEEMNEAFRGSIVEYHLSGFVENHEPLHKTTQKDIISFVNTDIPIIVESNMEDLEAVSDEFEYIMSKLH